MGRTHRNAAHQEVRRSSGPSNFFVTGHAFDQFYERVAPGLTPGRAKTECLIVARTARRTDNRTGTGDEIWVATNGTPVEFVVRRDPNGNRTCLTVLAPDPNA